MHRRCFIAFSAAAIGAAGTPAHAQDASTATLQISGGFSRATAKTARAGAGFLTIRSTGPADRLLGFSTPACERPELHTHINDDGIMRMRKVDSIEIPAGGEARLQPGGLHLMMIGLTRQLVEGDSVDVTLTFENAGKVTVSLPIKGPGAKE